ncbi:MAG: hypothetical protein Q9212_000629 [Teloschistes hypoglaucus]
MSSVRICPDLFLDQALTLDQNGYPPAGRQNESPVYLTYPCDESGRRPNEHASLQYANPSQREAYQRLLAAQSNQHVAVHQPDNQRHGTGTPQYNYDAPRQATMGPTSRAPQRVAPTTITGGSDYTSLGGSIGSGTRPDIQQPQTRYWWCSAPGCPYRGPYLESVYANCYHGCGATRNPGGHQEIYSLRERAPADVPSSSSPMRHPQPLQRPRRGR